MLMKTHHRLAALLLALALAAGILAGCAQDNAAPVDGGDATSEPPGASEAAMSEPGSGLNTADEPPLPPVAGDDIEATDYANADNWLNRPEMAGLPVDVFYLYPTAWNRQPGEDYVCEVDRAEMREGAEDIFNVQATAFEPVGNIYAPFYRQLDASWLLSLSFDEQDHYIEGVPYTDIVAAFEYYLEHDNGGRPFILAGHSQGSSMLRAMLIHYMPDHPDVYERMVAAYVIGYSITEEDLAGNPHLKFAEEAEDTGVIVSYNTEAPGLTADNPVVRPGSVAINPISWTRTDETAAAEESLGSYIELEDGHYGRAADFADATVDLERGTVVCSTVDIDTYSIQGLDLFPEGVYHGQDYGFYYFDIQSNASQRAEAWLSENGGDGGESAGEDAA